jgi:phenylpyruvate tautomerase PptA (4-oxalocrotonate tautomerase family)
MPTKIRQVKKKSDSLTKQEKQAFIKDLSDLVIYYLQTMKS